MRVPLDRPRSLIGSFAVLLGIAACATEPDLAPAESASTPTLAGAPGGTSSYMLRGTVLTPAGALKGGYVGIIDGRIAAASLKRPDIPGASIIGTDAIVLPGFVDLHNHVPWNVLPRWHPPRFYANRYEWRDDPDHQRAVRQPFDDLLEGDHFCEMNAWGELRALVGGTTSIMATHGGHPCVHGLVRNLDYNSGFYGTTELDREHIIDAIGIPQDQFGRTVFVAKARFAIGSPAYEALSLHVAEGKDATSEEEFTFLQSQFLLNPKGILIHAISLTATDFQAVAEKETALVWSPRSNLELYDTTADVGAALDAGVEVAVAPDWAVTGSSNMLDELKVAAAWNRSHLGGRLSPRQLVEMVTSVPAHAAGIEDEVGALQAGLRADLVVLRGDANDPYGSVLRAEARDVQLVVIDGVPLYGDPTLMLRFWPGSELEPVSIARGTKMLATRAAGVSPAALAAALRPLLEAEGTSLAALTEVAPPEPE